MKMLLLLLLCSTVIIVDVCAATYTSVQTGNWSVGTTWDKGSVPTSADDVVIANENTVTVGETTSCKTLTINSGGVLSIVSSSVVLSTTSTITIQGNLTMSAGTLNAGDGTSDFFYIKDVGGSLNFSGGIINIAGRYKQYSNGDAYLSGSSILNISTEGVQSASYNSFYVAGVGTIFSVASSSNVQIILKNGNSGSTSEFHYSPTTSNFDGGLFVIENTSGISDIYIKSDEPIYKIESNVGSGKTFHFNSDCDFSLTELTITSGSVQVDVGAEIDLTGTGTLGNNNALIIESTTDGTGSLIATGTVTGTATVQRYLTNNNGWHLLSSPVDGMTIVGSDFVPAASGEPAILPTTFDFYCLLESEATNPWINIRASDQSVNGFFESTFTKAKGYLVAYSASYGTTTFDFEGTLNTGTITTPTLTYTTGAQKGASLIGNPYSSAIDWSSATRTQFADNYAYIYNENHSGGPGYDEVTGTIAANQGFFVILNEANADETFDFTTAIQTHGGSFLKETSSTDKIVLRFGNSFNYDEVNVFYYTESSFNRDRNDAIKFFSLNSNIPQAYAYTSDDKQVAINSIPEINEDAIIPVSIYVPYEGSYYMSLVDITGEFLNGDIYLDDIKENNQIKISDVDSYEFEASPSDDPNRFVLHFGTTGINDADITANQIKIWSSNNAIQFINNKNLKGDINIVNLFGQVIANYELVGDSKQQINFTASTGLYIVSIKLDNGYVISKKVIIK